MVGDKFSIIMSVFLSVSLAQGWIMANEVFNDKLWIVFSMLFTLTIIFLILSG